MRRLGDGHHNNDSGGLLVHLLKPVFGHLIASDSINPALSYISVAPAVHTKPSTKIPRPMKAVVIEKPGPPDVLQIQERAIPVPKPGWVLIRVKAFGLTGRNCSHGRGTQARPSRFPVFSA